MSTNLIYNELHLLATLVINSDSDEWSATQPLSYSLRPYISSGLT